MSHAYYYVGSQYLFLKDFQILFLKNSFQNGIFAHGFLKMVQSSYIIAFVNNNMTDLSKKFSLIIRTEGPVIE